MGLFDIGSDPNIAGVATKTMTTYAPEASGDHQLTPQQRKLKAMYGTDPNLTNSANWQGNTYQGPDATYTGANGQGTATKGYTLGGGFQEYMSKYDPLQMTDADIRAGLAAGKQGSRGLSESEIETFMSRPGASQQYQSLAASQGLINQQAASNAAGAAASQAVSDPKQFQSRLNSMYAEGDPRRVSSNYSTQNNNGTYMGPGGASSSPTPQTAPNPYMAQQPAQQARTPAPSQPQSPAVQQPVMPATTTQTTQPTSRPVMMGDPRPQTGGGDPNSRSSPTGSGSTGPSPTDGSPRTTQTGGLDPNPNRRTGAPAGTSPTSAVTNPFNGGQNIPMLPNGTPDYMAIANAQSQYNQRNAQQQYNQNNPNQYNPLGSQVRTQNPDGTYSLTQSLNPTAQRNFEQSQALKSQLMQTARDASGNRLSYENVPGTPTFDPSRAPTVGQFDTSGVQGIPQANGETLNAARDALYQQQTQYLDPQFNQAQSDMESKLANQGLMRGSEAFTREMDNFNRTKQKAYGDARNSSILAGGQEQSRLFGLGLQANQAGQANALNQFNTGLQSHQTGINDLLAQFSTGMQGRQQGVSEQNALHNSPINDLNALNGMSNFQMPTYAGSTSNTIPGVDYMSAANNGFNATMGVNNAEAARQASQNASLFGLGNTFLNSQSGQSLINSLLGNGSNLFNLVGNGSNYLNNIDTTAGENVGYWGIE